LNFKTAASVETYIWTILLNSQVRSGNRALINSLFNGAPPYSSEEAEINHIATNVNTLESTELALSSRRHVSNAICSPDPLFSVNLDYGLVHKRTVWGKIIEKAINKRLIESSEFYDLREGIAGSVVLHGVGPSFWEDDQKWLQTELGIEDVLIPSNTLRSLRNLPAFGIYRSYSVNQLWKMTKGPKVDPGWNMPVVDAALAWVDKETTTLWSDNWKDTWYPEKMVERFKEDGGMYSSDLVPTIDCYDFFFWDDDSEKQGWKRRIVLDAWGHPGIGGIASKERSIKNRRKELDFGKGKFLYDSGDRIYADKLDKFIHFQFGDASAVRPARYHSIRSLGFLTYAVCHLQNRLKCKFNDAVFEALMQYFRVGDPADRDRLQKIDLVNMGILPEGLNFVKPEERWKIDQALVTEAISMNRQAMADQSSSFAQDYDTDEGEGETATRTMAKVNSQASLVSSMMNTIYYREESRYREIGRRFCIKDSRDADVRAFRVECLKQGVPQDALNVDRWNIKINKVMGGGNRMMEVAIADKMMAQRAAYPPEAQSEILRMFAGSVTGDWRLATSWVPDMPVVSDSMHDTEITFGALMSGSQVTPRPGLNPIEVVETMLKLIGGKVQQIMQSGGMGTPQEVQGLQMAAQYTESFIQQLAQDESQKDRVKQYGDALGKMMNEVKGMAQRQQQAAEKAQQQNGGDPKDAAKVQAMVLQAQTKAKLSSDSHAQKTAQRQLAFEAKERQSAQKHAADLMMETQKATLEIAKSRQKLFDE
jgi:hypothetical protein